MLDHGRWLAIDEWIVGLQSIPDASRLAAATAVGAAIDGVESWGAYNAVGPVTVLPQVALRSSESSNDGCSRTREPVHQTTFHEKEWHLLVLEHIRAPSQVGEEKGDDCRHGARLVADGIHQSNREEHALRKCRPHKVLFRWLRSPK